jgi:hypothetical protein
VNFDTSRQRFTRPGIFILLAILVVLLGAAAKHSQFDGPPSHGYLSKAVKMAGARVDPNLSSDPVQHLSSVFAQTSLADNREPVLTAPVRVRFSAVSVLSPPLRI